MRKLLSTQFSAFAVVLAACTLSLPVPKAIAQARLYNPGPLPRNNQITDTLSRDDIPTGLGGFAKDYRVEFRAGDQVVIDLLSDQFDTIVTLISADGETVAENDDGPDGSTNSLLFARIPENGTYTIRVRAFGDKQGGNFNLKMTHLRDSTTQSGNRQITDTLSRNDIPTGQGGFAKDYKVEFNEGEQVVIDLASDQFDTIVTLLSADGETVAENDDGPDGGTNSLLFARITKGGTYTVRVRAFGETRGGAFNLKMTRLQPRQ